MRTSAENGFKTHKKCLTSTQIEVFIQRSNNRCSFIGILTVDYSWYGQQNTIELYNQYKENLCDVQGLQNYIICIQKYIN